MLHGRLNGHFSFPFLSGYYHAFIDIISLIVNAVLVVVLHRLELLLLVKTWIIELSLLRWWICIWRSAHLLLTRCVKLVWRPL